MAGRDRTREILDVKKRSPYAHGFVSYELQDLIRQWSGAEGKEACVSDFYLIRAVTYLEVFTRRQVAGLVDHDKKYSYRAVELAKPFKLDLATVREVQGRVITLGDIVGHIVPVNSFAQIISYFETLLDKPLRPLLEGAVDRWDTEVKKLLPEPIIPDFEELARHLIRLFEVRHILCHEMASKPVYAAAEVFDFLRDAFRFSKALEEILTFEKFGLVPLTQTDMNIAAYERLTVKEKELEALLSAIRTGLRKFGVGSSPADSTGPRETWLSSFENAQEKWLSYRNAHCQFVGGGSGSMAPMLRADAATSLTEARIKYLRSWLELESERLVIFSSDEADSE